MDKKTNEQGKNCFIITPIGDTNSATFRKAKGVIDSVLKPVLSEYGFDNIKPAYEINVTGMITTQIINRIIDDDLVVVNLTGNNPNVMYELCLRHVVAKPIIHICESGTTLPFDIKDSRTVFYENDMLGVEELKKSIKEYLEEMDYAKEYSDNPIYNAKIMKPLLMQVQEKDGNSAEIALLQKIYDIIENSNVSINNRRLTEYDSNSYNRVAYDYCALLSPFNDNKDEFVEELCDELNRRNVRLVATSGNTLYFKNFGNTSGRRIMEIFNEIIDKNKVFCNVIKKTGYI